jgi:hypothetical protein
MGLKHGGYCLGCCWALMGLLFTLGVMNLLWITGISAFILLEKITPANQVVWRLSGLLFMCWAPGLFWTRKASVQRLFPIHHDLRDTAVPKSGCSNPFQQKRSTVG